MEGLEGFDEEARDQSTFFEHIGIHAYAEVLRRVRGLIGDGGDARAGIERAWAGRHFFAPYERPLLLLAALHREALADERSPLAHFLLRGAPVDVAELAQALTAPAPALATMRSRFVQTNEVTRAVAWRLVLPPAWAERPVALVDLGCSAGLNLVADRLALGWTTPEGEPVPLVSPGRIVGRFGLDRAPIDPLDPDEALWLRACLWPGQVARRARLDAAIDAATQARSRGEIELLSMDAEAMPAWVEALSSRLPEVCILAYQSIFAEYLVPEARASFETAMRAWVVRHEGRTVWARFETAPRTAPSRGLVHLTATFGRSGAAEERVVSGSEYHPSSVNVDAGALAEVRAALTGAALSV